MAEFVCGICLAILLGALESKLSKIDPSPVDEATFERSVEFEQQEWARKAARNGET